MAKLYGTPVGARNPTQMGRVPDLQMEKFTEGRINQGMVTMIDAADIPPGALQDAKNAVVEFDKTVRRPGSVLLTPVKPNSEPVMKLAAIKRQNGTAYTFRFTPTTIHSRGSSSWTNYPATTTALAGTVKDRFQTAIVLNEFVFSNNGANVVQMIDFGTAKYKALGNAPAYRNICGFANRVFGAALRDSNEVEVGWSADGVITEWDPAVNETAGKGPLGDSPSDLSDWITNIFSFTNYLLITRERSVWIGTKQPIPTNPVYFSNIVPGIGCDCPDSAAIVGESLGWLDRRSRTVYMLTPGSPAEPIGRPIEKNIIDNIDDPKMIFSAYNSIKNRFTIFIPTVASGYVNAWTYDLRGKTWTRQEYYALSSADNTDLAEGGITIDQLGDVPIESLGGTIDDLSPSSSVLPVQVYGRTDGTLTIEDENTNTDAEQADFASGIPFSTQLVSKCFTVPEKDIYIAQVVIEYQATLGGTFQVEYSRNGGATTASWRLAKTVTPKVLGEPRLIILRKPIRTRRFAWRLTTTAGRFEILSYEIHVYPSGKSKEDTHV